MSAYANFVQDFPTRCMRLLDKYIKQAKHNDLEVTLLLSIAATGIIVPYSRLIEKDHPSGDDERFRQTKEKLEKVLNGSFLSSALWSNSDPGSWQYCELKDLTGDPDAWGLEDLRALCNDRDTRSMVKILRNALAHGNIFTRGKPYINNVIFLSRKKPNKPECGYECVSVSPCDMRVFVLNWMTMLRDIEIPGKTFIETPLFETSDI